MLRLWIRLSEENSLAPFIELPGSMSSCQSFYPERILTPPPPPEICLHEYAHGGAWRTQWGENGKKKKRHGRKKNKEGHRDGKTGEKREPEGIKEKETL